LNLYEIDQAILGLVDPETGEIMDFDAFEKLQMDRHQKVENTALYIKNLLAEAEAIKAEESALKDRRAAKERRADGLKAYLSEFLGGEKFETPRCKVGFSKSTSVDLPDAEGFYAWAIANAPELVREKVTRDPVKAEIKTLILSGKEIPGAALVEKKNIQVK
jgi:Siphovirus Gp157.